MSLFKSNKTYIKRYSSKNFDKKITFAPSVRSTFLEPVTEIQPNSKTDKPVIEQTRPQGPNGTIRYAHDDKYKSAFVDKTPAYTKSEVISGPADKRPDPIDKPDLTGVKAEDKVRPILDDKVDFSNSITPETDSTNNTTVINKPDPIPTPATNVEKQTVIKTEQDNKAEQIKKANKDLKKEFKSSKKIKKSSIHAGDVFAIATKSLVIVALIAAVGFGGYKAAGYVVNYIEQNKPPVENTIMYAPADYIYPQTPQNIAEANENARKQEERDGINNEYKPKKHEVPGLYKYDYVKTCYLTFDDGPSEAVTNQILDTLKEHDIKATFFVVGKNAKSYPDIIRRMDAEGHSIGNHSYSHDYDELYSGDEEFDDEISDCEKAINDILGKKYENKIFRFPGGSTEKPRIWYISNVGAHDYQYIDWNSLTGDSETETPDRDYIMSRLAETTNNGKKEDIILLMHDAGAKTITAETLPEVIEYLKSKNYVFKPIYNSNYTVQ